MKPIQCVRSLCETVTEYHINRQLCMQNDEDCEPLADQERMCLLRQDPDCQWDDRQERDISGAVGAVLSVASGEVRQKSPFKLAHLQPVVVGDPVAGESLDPVANETLPDEDPSVERMPAPRDPSEVEKEKHSLPRIQFHPWRTASVNGEAQAELHQRSERVIEDNELPFVHCDYMFMKDVAASDGLTMLSMYMKSFGYGMSHEVETKAADVRAVTWGVLNCLRAILSPHTEKEEATSKETVTNGHPQTILSNEKSSSNLPETVPRKSVHVARRATRPHTKKTDGCQRTGELEHSSRSFAHYSFQPCRCAAWLN